MTAEESENFIKGIIKDIKENNVTYVGDNIRNKIKMCSIGNVSKVVIDYDNNGEVVSVLVIKKGVFHRVYTASPLREKVLEIEKLCSEKGVDENIPVNKKNPRTR